MDAIEQQPDKPVDQQNAMIEKLGGVEAVADALPQLIEIESGLSKHKKKILTGNTSFYRKN